MNIFGVFKAIAELAGKVNVVDIIFCVGGVLVLAWWLLKTSLGTKALVHSRPRRNNMHPLWLVVVLLLWFEAGWILFFIKEKVLADLAGWKDALIDNLILCISAIPAVVIILLTARACFARRLKGLGLNPATIPRDLGAGLINLIAIMPVVLAMIILTTLAGKLIVGPEFEMPRHEELKEVIAYPQWQARAMIIFTAVVVIPFTEELVFRGMLQTVLRSYIIRPWSAIMLTSLVFVAFHGNPQHWPALFALALCLGYTYEKSGSLFRSIFVHSFFNALSVFAALAQ